MKAILSSSKLDPHDELEYLVETGALPACDLPLPQGYLSVSQIGTYLRCARQYEFRYVNGIIIPPRARLAEGTAMHKALEAGHRERKASGTTAPLSMLLDAHNDAWKTAKADIEVWEEDDDKEEDILKRGRIFLSKYHKEYLPKIKPVGIENRFWLSVGAAGVPILGYIDLIAEEEEAHKKEHQTEVTGPEIVDYKVVGKTKAQSEVDNDIQLTVYSGAVNTTKVRFDMFVKKKDPVIQTVRSLRTPSDWAWAAEVFEGIALAIARGVFPPCMPTNWACSEAWCGYYKKCRGKR